ncbi:MAG TPA: Trp biosynthesis-associated membrane protein, partial [Mycobacterium sp.]|nr:Trp biosynthesis-associated membrane protein [Mycobacterium sp.]
VGAVLLMRAARARADVARYVRRAAPQSEEPGAGMSERTIWDALDEGRDPTNGDNKGR